jgi:hypothetical protein
MLSAFLPKAKSSSRDGFSIEEREMKINTAAEGISLARKLESEGSEYYQKFAQVYPEEKETFLTYAKENQKYIAQIERSYYGVITDAIEGCYAFNLDPDQYHLDTSLTKETQLTMALEKALRMEELIVRFYQEAIQQSEGIMADIPRTFALIVRNRQNRINTLKSKTIIKI